MGVFQQPVNAIAAAHPCCGARVFFEGVVRNHNEGKAVEGIEYECFEPMARRELGLIISEARQKWPVHEVFLAHRTGQLEVGETSLFLLVLSPHRKEAFSAAQYIIDELKKRAPIWKKEYYADGKKEWVECRC